MRYPRTFLTNLVMLVIIHYSGILIFKVWTLYNYLYWYLRYKLCINLLIIYNSDSYLPNIPSIKTLNLTSSNSSRYLQWVTFSNSSCASPKRPLHLESFKRSSYLLLANNWYSSKEETVDSTSCKNYWREHYTKFDEGLARRAIELGEITETLENWETFVDEVNSSRRPVGRLKRCDERESFRSEGGGSRSGVLMGFIRGANETPSRRLKVGGACLSLLTWSFNPDIRVGN